MTYPTFINVAYWTLATLILALLVVIAALAFLVLVMRTRRFKDLRRSRELRRLMIESSRQSRAMEDTCWFLLRGRDARIAETIADSKAVVRLVTDLRTAAPKLEVV